MQDKKTIDTLLCDHLGVIIREELEPEYNPTNEPIYWLECVNPGCHYIYMDHMKGYLPSDEYKEIRTLDGKYITRRMYMNFKGCF